MIKKGYSNNGVAGGTKQDVACMMGEHYDNERDEFVYEGTIPQIVRRGGFRIKFMISSGETRPCILEEFNGYMLGLPWEPGSDLISMHMGVNLSTKKQKVCLGDEITLNTLGDIDDVLLTRRIMVSQIYSLYDLLGLLSPITLKYKLILQQLVQTGIGWDEPLPADIQKTAKSALREIVETRDVAFHRSVVPAGAQGKPQLVGFLDGGKPASAACLYVRYKTGDTGFEMRLLASKARVTPSSDKTGKPQVSMPRIEMRGLLFQARLITGVLPGMVAKSGSIFLAGD